MSVSFDDLLAKYRAQAHSELDDEKVAAKE